MMRTYRGIVCEKKNKYSVFLTKEGEFLRGIPLESSPEIGEEARFHLLEETTQNRKWIKPSVLGPLLAAAVLFIFAVVSLIPSSNVALAYVQLDGKSSVELGVNKNGKVVTLRSLNKNVPIDLDDWEGNPIEFVLAKAVKQMSPVTEKLAITTIYENKEQSADIRKIIEVAVEEVKNEQTGEVWTIKESTIDEREEANKHNTSIQKLKQKERHSNIKRKMDANKKIDYNQNNRKNDDENNNEKQHTPPKETSHTNKASNHKKIEKQQEKQFKEQEKIKEKIEKQQDKKTKEIDKQQEKQQKTIEKAAKRKEKEKEKIEKDKEREKNKEKNKNHDKQDD